MQNVFIKIAMLTIFLSILGSSPASLADSNNPGLFKTCYIQFKRIFSQAAEQPLQATFYRDNKGMPKYLEDIKQPAFKVKFYWKSSRVHKKDIYAVRTFWGQPIGINKVADGASHVFGYELPPEIIKAFEQIKRGGNKFRSEDTVEEFLAHHPISTYDYATNVSLTKDYGAEFSGQVYKYLRDNQEDNKWAKETVLRFIKDKDSLTFPIGEKFKGIKVLVASGYLEGPKTSPSLPLVNMLRGRGVDVEYFNVDFSAPVDVNIKAIANELRERLGRGEKLVLWGLSKGVGEILGALSEVRDIVDSKDGSVPGQVMGVLSTSKNMGRSFVVDWATKYPQFAGVKYFVHRFAKSEGVTVPDVRTTLKSLTSPVLGDYLDSHPLPQSPIYMEISGVAASNYGYSPDPDFRKIQEKVFSLPVFPKAYANDSFLEYPGTEISRKLVTHLYQLTFNASHRIVDGDFEGYDMKDPEIRDRVFASLFRFMYVALTQPTQPTQP